MKIIAGLQSKANIAVYTVFFKNNEDMNKALKLNDKLKIVPDSEIENIEKESNDRLAHFDFSSKYASQFDIEIAKKLKLKVGYALSK